jgi:gliding motility-associated-like protein
MISTKHTLLLATLFLFLIHEVKSQDIIDNKVYRVTAYKKGNNTINSVSNYAEVIPPLSIYIPSAFTPNNDGINDTFGVKGEGITNFHIYIYNRWGELLFETTNPKQQWDGNFKGRKSEQGTYVYKLMASGMTKERTGMVNLIY